ncbi:helix-turn-helix transcriptional regulator [Christensenellaceae bacterium OttesenSCG-928-K19]|nr:helix-turn-helix transcriptional regulator [Christensenellaceae bacterium OttesenSCG-928-K19]
MTFGKKVKILRTEKGWSQKEVAEQLGITMRAYQNYELNNVLPRKKDILTKLCEMYGVTKGQLLDDNDLFYIDVRERYGAKGEAQAKKILGEAQAYLAGGDIKDEDREAFMESFMRMYLRSKELAKEKYGKKKK